MITVNTYTLIIKRADGSTYWQMWANDTATLEAWIATEQTRPYWDPTYTWTITQIS